jgi:LPS export ABC transporter protein LptC
MKTPGSDRPSKAPFTFPALLAAGSMAAMILLASLSACRNDIETVRSLDFIDTLPAMTADDIEIIYSEKGKVQIRLVSPRLISKETETEPILVFPDGFTVYFYDSIMKPTSTISADYGISYEKKKLMEARHNVVVVNTQKNEQLNTEELFWDQNKEVIYSETFVKITSGQQVIYGEGLYSKQPFDVMEVYKTSGVLEIKEEPGK